MESLGGQDFQITAEATSLSMDAKVNERVNFEEHGAPEYNKS